MPPPVIPLVRAAEAQIEGVFDPHIVAEVNEAHVKIAKFGASFDWHAHPDEDEAFLVLKGRIAIDFRDGSRELTEGEFLLVPRGMEHRPRALSEEPVVLMFERAGTLNTGDAVDSVLTVAAPKVLAI
ncbi:MAG: cupin domain-containing protein [Parvularcula sp.]|jgi:mannose-6-phosphate isomerase-like protein (cupin superfamily)|nr:cupin domain-containing protein [Parvularcula sp.]